MRAMRSVSQTQKRLVLASILILLIIAAIMSPGFDSPAHLVDVLALAALLAVAALGQTVIMLTGGIDLSMGFVMTLSGAIIMQVGPQNLAVGLALALGLGALVGIVNGLGIELLHIPPLIMTLASGSIAQGALYLYTGGTTSSVVPQSLYALINGSPVTHLFFPNVIVIAAILGGGVSLLLSRTVFGRSVYAVGSGVVTARLSGVPVERVTVWVYVIGGIMAAAAGVLVVGYYGQESLGTGTDYLLPAIAAVVIGGTSMLGGEGTFVGTALGALLLIILTSLLTVLNLSTAAQQVLYGLVIIIMLVVRRRGVKQTASAT